MPQFTRVTFVELDIYGFGNKLRPADGDNFFRINPCWKSMIFFGTFYVGFIWGIALFEVLGQVFYYKLRLLLTYTFLFLVL